MDRIRMRRMTPEDVEAVVAIERDTFAKPWSAEELRHEMMENKVARFLVAERGDRVIGYAGAWIILDESHILNIAVEASERGKGIGTALTEALLAYLSNLGASYATLEVRESNLAAQRVYQKLGFLSVGRRKRYYTDNNEDAFLMVCDKMPEVDPEFTEEGWEQYMEEART